MTRNGIRSGEQRLAHRDDWRRLCRSRLWRLLCGAGQRGRRGRGGRGQARQPARGRHPHLRARLATAGSRQRPHRPPDLRRRHRRRGGRRGRGVHCRGHAHPPGRRPCRLVLRVRRRRAGGARADRLHGHRHQIDRAGWHRPPYQGDPGQRAPGPHGRRGLEPGIPARGQRHPRLHAAGPRGDRRGDRPGRARCCASSTARST